MKDGNEFLFDDWNTRTLGDGWGDRDRLRKTSPVALADRIRRPVLVAYGTNDHVVHVEQAHAMVESLEDAGADVEVQIYRSESHGFIDERNRIDFHEKLADFFERHLGHGAPAVAAGGDPSRRAPHGRRTWRRAIPSAAAVKR